MSDLVERLREWNGYNDNLMGEAADRIPCGGIRLASPERIPPSRIIPLDRLNAGPCHSALRAFHASGGRRFLAIPLHPIRAIPALDAIAGHEACCAGESERVNSVNASFSNADMLEFEQE